MNHSPIMAPLPVDMHARSAVIDAAYGLSDLAAAQWCDLFGSPPSLDQQSVLLDQSMRVVLTLLNVKGASKLDDLAKRIDQLEAAKRCACLPANLLVVRSA